MSEPVSITDNFRHGDAGCPVLPCDKISRNIIIPAGSMQNFTIHGLQSEDFFDSASFFIILSVIKIL